MNPRDSLWRRLFGRFYRSEEDVLREELGSLELTRRSQKRLEDRTARLEAEVDVVRRRRRP